MVAIVFRFQPNRTFITYAVLVVGYASYFNSIDFLDPPNDRRRTDSADNQNINNRGDSASPIPFPNRLMRFPGHDVINLSVAADWYVRGTTPNVLNPPANRLTGVASRYDHRHAV